MYKHWSSDDETGNEFKGFSLCFLSCYVMLAIFGQKTDYYIIVSNVSNILDLSPTIFFMIIVPLDHVSVDGWSMVVGYVTEIDSF